MFLADNTLAYQDNECIADNRMKRQFAKKDYKMTFFFKKNQLDAYKITKLTKSGRNPLLTLRDWLTYQNTLLIPLCPGYEDESYIISLWSKLRAKHAQEYLNNDETYIISRIYYIIIYFISAFNIS